MFAERNMIAALADSYTSELKVTITANDTNAGAYFTPRLQAIHCDVTPILLTTPLDVGWLACDAC